MSENKDEKIEDVLVDSELAKKLVPNKFKFTSQQGRARRQKLLAGAKKLSETLPINDITLAAVCEEAGIPRASAYHFFPNIEAIFLALRFLNAIEILEIVETVDIGNYDRWQGYLTALIDQCVTIFHNDETKAKLIYDTNTPDFEGDSFGEDINYQIIDLVYKRLSERYEMPGFHDIQDTLLIAYSIINSIFTLSYRRHQKITDEYIQEANIAFIAYLRCYLPEKLPRKKSSV
ncbi:MAG: TetR/AcrR family transcriptional regulator [Psychrobacter sp.]|uniref:TetR/AcrR family transcriptional regulator n=1 Tax=unclassified Psychrobacter TaxID=196806 RepID=UPI0017889D70|nr:MULTISPECIES: TetR/AcrR family transcriptional regulator [unclassified Psychrobacter]MBE0443377.1 TetR/AcrR family transcriptional regulator [Psychrobacter sp. FME13]